MVCVYVGCACVCVVGVWIWMCVCVVGNVCIWHIYTCVYVMACVHVGGVCVCTCMWYVCRDVPLGDPKQLQRDHPSFSFSQQSMTVSVLPQILCFPHFHFFSRITAGIMLSVLTPFSLIPDELEHFFIGFPAFGILFFKRIF